MTQSFPEKTFEHWCTIHLGYRYRAHVHMWWPAFGADIEIAAIPGAPGKRIWLELKTTTWKPRPGHHDLRIDLEQLEAYRGSPVPDYYVFPIPPWSDVLAPATPWLAGLTPGSLAYQSQSGAHWFAEWTWVVQGAVLRSGLAAEIAAWAAGGARKKDIARVTGGRFAWTRPGLRGVTPMKWKPFWEAMQQCGSGTLPAQFILPAGAALPRNPSRSDLVGALSIAKKEGHSSDGTLQGTIAYSPTGDRAYGKASNDGLTEGFAWEDPHRSLTFLGVDALRL